MALPYSYKNGTASVAAGSTNVTGSGTAWLAAGLQSGDVFTVAGLSVSIASVNSATSITLAFPWGGVTVSGAAYEVRYTPDTVRVMSFARQAIDRITEIDADLYASLNIYATTAAGIAAVANGEQFSVVSGNDLVRYRRSGSTAVELARLPTSAAMTQAVTDAQAAAGQVAGVVAEVREARGILPLFTAGDRVLIWLEDGAVRWSGQEVAGRVFEPERPTAGASLHRWRMAAQRVRSGIAGAKARVALMGDSWSEMVALPAALAALLGDELGLTGEGWRPAPATPGIGASSWASTGWTVTDASSATAFPYGVGPDGHCCHTTDTTAQMTLTGIVATSARIYHFKHGGTWRWRVDSGAWTVVTDDSSGALGIVAIDGLSDAAHTIQIDTTGNAGVVAIAGLYTTRAATGAELLRLGNGGMTGLRLSGYVGQITGAFADLQPDVAVVVLGTNDAQSSGSGPNQYIAGLSALVAACRAAVPDIGFVFVLPPQGGAAAVTPLTAYRDALFEWAHESGHEVISGLDRWSGYATANAHGLWADINHLSPLGAQVLAHDINSHFLRG